MSTETPSSPAPLPTPAAPPPASKKRSCLLYGCGALLALVLVIAGTVAITYWWIQRPIKPVVLSASEKATVDEKLQHLSGGNAAAQVSATTSASAPTPNRRAKAGASPPAAAVIAEANPGPGRPYVPGSKVFKLTDREINGLLNANTELGQAVRLEFAQDAVNAYVAVRIPADFPIGGGKMFRARGSFRVSLGNGGAPYAVLEDVTVFGLSLPKAWLGGLKGQNLIGQAVGEGKGSPVLRGIKTLRVEPGALVLEVED
jgi:hypothetical protein